MGLAIYMYAGVTEGRARGGVGIVIVEPWADCVKSWRCNSGIMVKIKIVGV